MEKKYGLSIKWLAVSSFEIRCDGMTVVTDPYITECVGTDVTWEAVESCDIICLGHSHWDHITDIPRLAEKFSPRILCGDQTAMPMAQWLDYDPAWIYPMYPDTELDFGAVKIRALYGRHKGGKGGFNNLCKRLAEHPLSVADPGLAALQPIGSMEYRNYLLTFPNGTKLLVWGSELTVEQTNMCKALAPDIAIIQRPTSDQDIEDRAEFAREIGCKVVIPHHHDFLRVDDPAVVAKFRDAFLGRCPDCEFITPAHGEWVHL